MPDIAVKTVSLKKIHKLGSAEVHALDGVDLEIYGGEYVSIQGASGSGKSTLLTLIGALDRPTEGKVFIGKTELSTLNRNQTAELRRRIGFVFQSFNLVPNLTAKENVELSLSIIDVPRSERAKTAKRLLDQVGLSDRMDHKPNQLSGGQQQRVAIARALATDPPLLLMDEPTGNLDFKNTGDVLALIRDIHQREGITIIMITHDMNIAQRANRIIVMDEGRIVEQLQAMREYR